MPSRLIQLNGMNINAGGLIEFRATMQAASQVSCTASKFELVINLKIAKAFGLEICASVKISLCNFDHESDRTPMTKSSPTLARTADIVGAVVTTFGT